MEVEVYRRFIEVRCPFCEEGDFDFFGLKVHLLNGWCDKFNAVQIPVPDLGRVDSGKEG